MGLARRDSGFCSIHWVLIASHDCLCEGIGGQGEKVQTRR